MVCFQPLLLCPCWVGGGGASWRGRSASLSRVISQKPNITYRDPSGSLRKKAGLCLANWVLSRTARKVNGLAGRVQGLEFRA